MHMLAHAQLNAIAHTNDDASSKLQSASASLSKSERRTTASVKTKAKTTSLSATSLKTTVASAAAAISLAPPPSTSSLLFSPNGEKAAYNVPFFHSPADREAFNAAAEVSFRKKTKAAAAAAAVSSLGPTTTVAGEMACTILLDVHLFHICFHMFWCKYL
jgi:hypothetical protein